MAAFYCKSRSCFAPVVRQVFGCPSLQKQAHELDLALSGCEHQRRWATGVGEVFVDACLLLAKKREEQSPEE